MQRCGDKLLHVQLSETHRGTLGEGHVPLTGVVQQLKRMNYTGMVSIEAFSPKLAVANIWRKMFVSETQLMQQSLLCLQKLLS